MIKFHLTAVVGPMASGKSTELLRRYQRSVLGGNPALIFRSSADTRPFIARGHPPIPALPETALQEATSDHPWLIDEVQFIEFLPSLLRVRCQEPLRVAVFGLDLDAEGRPFPVTAELLAMADEVVKLTAVCTVCGADAPMTQRTKPGVSVGDLDAYQPRCRGHWRATP